MGVESVLMYTMKEQGKNGIKLSSQIHWMILLNLAD